MALNVLREFFEKEGLGRVHLIPISVDSESWNDLTSIFSNRYGFEISHENQVLTLSTHYIERDVFGTEKRIPLKFYAIADDFEKILYIISNDYPKKYLTHTLGRVITHEKKIYYLPMGPKCLSIIKNKILEEYNGSSVKQFWARRNLWESDDCEIRPVSPKSMNYAGVDATDFLREAEKIYGVYPTTLEMNTPIPNYCDFTLSSNGIFSFSGGKYEIFLDIVEKSLQHPLNVRRILKKSKLEQVPIKVKNGEIKVLKSNPFILKFSSKWDEKFGGKFLEVLSKEARNEGKFTISNPTLSSGSLLLSAEIIDEDKGAIFSIDADENQMGIIPQYGCSPDVLQKFYYFFIENIDHNVECLDLIKNGQI